MPSKIPTTARIVIRALLVRLFAPQRRRKPDRPPGRILVAHHLLLGDTMLLTPLIAKLREQYPAAEIVLTTPVIMLPLYQGRPYGVTVWPFNPRDFKTVAAMFAQDGFDLAIVPGDNRHAWLAAALRSRWIVAHAGDRPAYRSWLVDELPAYPTTPMSMGEIFAELVPGPAPRPYRQGDWPSPACRPFALPAPPYAVLHVGASSPLKFWSADKWRALAGWLTDRSIEVVWSGGRNEAAIVAQIDPERRYRSYAEQLDLAQLWQLVANAALLVCPDTGVAHLARLTGTPTITLFGPGSASLFGRGRFWQSTPCVEVTIEDFPCRDQAEQFRREVSWIRRCGRTPSECPAARCMQAIGTAAVIDAAARLLDAKPAITIEA